MLTSFDKALLNILQTGLPVAPQPYQAIARQLGCDEETVLSSLRRLKTQGYIRRMGAFFDSTRLGFVSTLVALKVQPEYVPSVAKAVNAYAGVTHNYERESEYNLWFAITQPDSGSLKQALAEISSLPGVEQLLDLPATQKFKVSVEFNLV